MKMKSNYHAHTYRCQHAVGTEKEYIEAAIKRGIETFGFSDHIFCPFDTDYVSDIRMTVKQAPEYVDTIRKLGKEYEKDIRILVGFEAEYNPAFFEEQMKIFTKLDCDYLIMGQHFLGDERDGIYMGRPTRDESILTEYVNTVIEGMKTGKFLYLAHPDLINFVGPKSVFEREMERMCKALRKMNIPMEMNALGVREGRHYPNDVFWKIVSKVGNSTIIGIDAHDPLCILSEENYEQSVAKLKKFGLIPLDKLI